jgi:predicted dehydrogenase
MRVLVIGTSAIARNHIEVLHHSGANVIGVCGNQNQGNLERLAQDFSIPKTFLSWEQAIGETQVESLILCTPPEVTFQILSYISGSGMACLAEKPAVGSELDLKKLQNFSLDRTFVAFNRRHYETVVQLKSHIGIQPDGELVVEIHESESPDTKGKKDQIVNNSIHILDLILFIFESTFKDIEILSALKTNLGVKIQLVAKQVPISISIKFGIPGNTSMTYDSAGSRFILKPIEKISRYNGFSIQQPSKVSSIRVYHPTWSGQGEPQVNEDSSQFKPGFLNQARAFKYFVDGESNKRALCSISEAIESLEFAYSLARLL